MTAIDILDKRILDVLQNDFPLCEQPFQAIAERVKLSEAEVLARIAAMKNCGLIRRIGGIFDSGRMGFYSTLCAASVPESRIPQVAAVINGLPGVTHNYLRAHDYNLWFTLTAPGPAEAAEIIAWLEDELDLHILNMPASKLYKIRVSFPMEADYAD